MLHRVLPESGPVRVLTIATLINTVGGGLFFTGSMLFFTRVVGLPATQVGVGLTAAGLVGLAAGVPLGHLGDRLGRREVYVVLLLLQAVTAAGYVLVETLAGFLVVATSNLIAQSGAFAVRNALVASLGGPEERVRIRARLRAVLHVGFAAGAGLGAVALQIDTPQAYTAMMLGDAASFVVAALVLTRMPRQPPTPALAGASRWEAVRDRGYLAVTAVSSVMALHYGIWLFIMPLWVVERTAAPHWVVSVLLVLGTVIIIVFQVRASRGTERVRPAAAVMRRAGLTCLVGCAVLGAAGGLPARAAVVALLGGTVILAVGELWHAAGSFGLSYALAADHAQGQYQGVFGIGLGGMRALAPGILTPLCIVWGGPGWMVVGGLFAVAGLATPAVAAWAARTGPRSGRPARITPQVTPP
ncbi:MAG: MFS transporter [Streptomycetales bacterium]